MDFVSQSVSKPMKYQLGMVIKEADQEDVALFFYSLSPNTYDAYSYDLKLFFAFLELKGLSIYDTRQIHIEEFMNFVSINSGKNQKVCSDRTYNRKLSALKSFFNYLCEKRILNINPCAFVKLRNIPLVVVTEYIEKLRILELFELIPSDTLMHKRDRAIMGVLFYTGCRVMELVNLKIKDYCFHAKGKKLVFVTKGNKPREVPVTPELQLVLDDYLQARFEELGYSDDDPLFTNLKCNQPLARSSINLIFKKWVRKLKLPYKTSPHSARTSLIVILSENRVDLKKQAETVGHASIAMTNAYNNKRAMLEESPIMDIKLL